VDIAKQISDLLGKHECVVIPDFGGFILAFKPAEIYVVTPANRSPFTKQAHFMPPKPVLVFNPNITTNDGLLAYKLAAAHKISYEDACAEIQNFVKSIYAQLKHRAYPLEGLGVFQYNLEGQLLFESDKNLSFITFSNGLPEFEFPLVHRDDLATKINRQIKSNRTFAKVKRSNWFRAAVIAIPLALALTFFPAKKYYQNNFSASLNPLVTTNSASSISPKKQYASLGSVIMPNTKNVEKYSIVAGSFTDESNASVLAEKLKASGYTPETINSNGTIRVVFSTFDSKDVALTALEKLRTETGNQSLWLLKLDN